MNANVANVPKPRSLSDAEWKEVHRAARRGYFHYVFWSGQFISPLLGMLLGTFGYQLSQAGGEVFAAIHAMPWSGLRIGFCAIVLFVVMRRSLDWHGQRATAKAAGLRVQ